MNKITIAYFKAIGRISIVAFRGALLKLMGDEVDTAFHHHEADGLVYGYPKVQYKMIDGRPAVLSVDVSLQPLVSLFDEGGHTLCVGRKDVFVELDEVVIKNYAVAIDDAPKHYRVVRYLPLNEKNVVEYGKLIALTDKICFLEDILTANILSFFKGIGYHAEEQVELALTAMRPSKPAYYKKVGFRCFDLEFVTNVVLPQHIGLGKSSSVGFGVVGQISPAATDTP